MPLSLPDHPDFIPYGSKEAINPGGIANLDTLGNYYDQKFYGRSDKNFKKRHGGLLQAEHLFEDSALADQQGDSELMPAIQNEFVRGGLANSLAAFGGSDGALAPGSAGEASVARNLGTSIIGFQDRNRANRNQSLVMAESLFPRRSFGLSGADATSLAMQNAQGLNSFNQAKYSTDTQIAQSESNQQIGQANADAQADAQKQQAAVGAGIAIASVLVLAL